MIKGGFRDECFEKAKMKFEATQQFTLHEKPQEAEQSFKELVNSFKKISQDNWATLCEVFTKITKSEHEETKRKERISLLKESIKILSSISGNDAAFQKKIKRFIDKYTEDLLTLQAIDSLHDLDVTQAREKINERRKLASNEDSKKWCEAALHEAKALELSKSLAQKLSIVSERENAKDLMLKIHFEYTTAFNTYYRCEKRDYRSIRFCQAMLSMIEFLHDEGDSNTSMFKWQVYSKLLPEEFQEEREFTHRRMQTRKDLIIAANQKLEQRINERHLDDEDYQIKKDIRKELTQLETRLKKQLSFIKSRPNISGYLKANNINSEKPTLGQLFRTFHDMLSLKNPSLLDVATKFIRNLDPERHEPSPEEESEIEEKYPAVKKAYLNGTFFDEMNLYENEVKKAIASPR